MISTPPPQAFVEPYAIKPKDAYAKFTTRIRKRLARLPPLLSPPKVPIDKGKQRAERQAIKNSQNFKAAVAFKKTLNPYNNINHV